MDEVPPGFQRHFRKSPVTDPWEPIYSCSEADNVIIGVRLALQHCNSRGLVHGGVLAALADNAMGLTVVRHARARTDPDARSASAMTISLGVDYAAPAQPGQWLQVTPRIIHLTRTMGFADALLSADGATIARANATFRLGGQSDARKTDERPD